MATKKKTTTESKVTRIIMAFGPDVPEPNVTDLLDGNFYHSSSVEKILEDLSDDGDDQSIYEVTFRKIGMSKAPVRTFVKE